MAQQDIPSLQQHPDYASPLADTVFIRLFATNERKYNTLNLLKAIFENDPVIHIDDITINDPRFPGETKKTRGCICDLHCSCNGKSYLIELQMYNEAKVFMDRAVFNMSKQISTDQEAGLGHTPIKGTIFIGFTNFDLDELEGRDIVRVALGDMDKPGTFFLTDRFRLFFFQLNNFNKTIENCITKLDYWLYSLKNLPNMKQDDELTRRIMEKVHELSPFFDDAKYERMTPEEQNEYLLYCSNIEYERQGRIARETKEEMIREREEKLKENEEKLKENEEKLKENEEKLKESEEKLKEKEEKLKENEEKLAEKEIMIEKREASIEQKSENLKQEIEMLKLKGKLETAKAMKAEGIPAETIAKCTGLSIEVISSL